MSSKKVTEKIRQRGLMTVLAVDDDKRMRDSVVELLKFHKYKVLTAEGGKDALTKLEHHKVDIMLLDLCMGDISGHQVMEYLIKNELNVLVIVVSGDTSIESAIESLRHGAYDYIRKPYAPEELIARLDSAANKLFLEKENTTIRARLENSEKLYRFMVNSSPDIVYMLDENGHFTFINDKISSLGYERTELIGKHFSKLIYSEDIGLANFSFNERRTGQRATSDFELRLHCKNSSVYAKQFDICSIPIEVTAMGVYRTVNNENQFVGTYGVARDLTVRKKAEETIKYQAYHDLLTGLPNRVLFKDHLSLAMAQVKRRETCLAVMFMDLDRFKVINDTLGHVMGDNLLRAVSLRLNDNLRSEDTLSRIGGDEFIILLSNIKDQEEAENVAEKLIQALKEPFNIESYELYVTGSIGITYYPQDGKTMDTLIKNADVAMYHAKRSNSGGYQTYSSGMDERFSKHLSIEGDLRRSIEADEFLVYYQPQVNVITGEIVGIEALVRWQHPEYGLLLPADFISIAEESGLIGEIGQSLFRTACTDLKSWYGKGLPKVRLAVNLSALEVVKKSFVDNIINVLKEFDLPGDCLEIEITESVILNDLEHVIQRLSKLSNYGVTIAIDDFGTGYSSLSYLQKLPIHTLKIDRSFLKDVASKHEGSSIVAAIIAMAQGLNLNTVAEGVETEGQKHYLESLGCDDMQGFLFSQPVIAKEMENILRNKPFIH